MQALGDVRIVLDDQNVLHHNVLLIVFRLGKFYEAELN
jgi:hypothetical protein